MAACTLEKGEVLAKVEGEGLSANFELGVDLDELGLWEIVNV